MMMLKVVEIDSGASSPQLSGDEHVPLMARWELSPSVVWQATFPDGRIFCEVKLSTPGGRINGITILNLPSIDSAPTVHTATLDEPGMPVLSLDNFDPNADLIAQSPIVKFPCAPSATVGKEWFEIRFDQAAPVKWYSVEGIGFGVNDGELVVAIRVPSSTAARLPALPHK